METAQEAGIEQDLLDEFERDAESRMQKDIQEAAKEDAAFAQANEQQIRRRNALLEDGIDPSVLDAGRSVEAPVEEETKSAQPETAQSETDWRLPVLIALVLIAIGFIAIRMRRR